MDMALHHHRSRILPIRYLRARPRLFACTGLGIVAFFLMPDTWHLVTRLLISWNLGTVFFLVFILQMMLRATHDTMRRNAVLHDEGQYAVLTLAVIAALVSTGAIVAQFGLVKEATGFIRAFHIILAIGTIVTAWTFVHIMFALHYAHEYFDEWRAGKDQAPELRGGLEIPGIEKCPNYLDFAYFSFTIGVASATSDVNVTSSLMRRIVLVHSVLAFFFNMAVLGLTINIAAGLI
jgi:uncharacterized membrane protein